MTGRHLRTRLSSLFRRKRYETELDVELQYHIDMLVQQNVAAGMPPDEARTAALRSFGAVQGIKDDVRDTWLSRFFETAAQDVRYGVRNLRRNPGFAFVVIVDDGARHRCQHRHLQRRQRRAAEAAALSATATSSSSSVMASAIPSPTIWASRSRDLNDYRAVALPQRHRRVPQHVLHAARRSRGRARVHWRRVGELLRRARREAGVRPHASWTATTRQAHRPC